MSSAGGGAAVRVSAGLIVALSAVLAGCTALAGCAASTAAGVAATGRAAQPLSLAMSVVTPTATWAVVQTGGRAAGGKFWQLLVRPRHSSWRLVTPPGVADNGGLVTATVGNAGLVAGFVPSEQLKFTPLAITSDEGAHWSQGLLPASLVASPGALAALPSGRLLAATTKGVEESAHGAAGWSVLVSLRMLAATPAGRACGLIRLSAVGASPSGTVLAGGQCAHPGEVVVFAQSGGGWRAASLKLTRSLARRPVAVQRLTGAALGPNVILVAGTARAQTVFAASLTGSGRKLSEWGRTELTAGPGPSFFLAQSGGWGAVIGREAQYEIPAGPQTGPFQGVYNAAPDPLPRPDATVAFGSGSFAGAETDLIALVPGLDTVAVWHEGKSDRWARMQVIGIPSGPG